MPRVKKKKDKKVTPKVRSNQDPSMNRKIIMNRLFAATFKDISIIEDSNLFEREEHRDNTFRIKIKDFPNYIFVVDQRITEIAKAWLRGKVFFWETHLIYIRIVETNQGNVKPAPFNVSFYEYCRLYFKCANMIKERATNMTLHNAQRITMTTLESEKNGKR